MKRTRNFGVIGVLIVLCFSLIAVTGCKKEEEPANKKILLRFANQHPIDHFATEAAKRFGEKIKKQTNGRIEVQLYPANQLGDYVQVFEEVMRGTIDMAHITFPNQYDYKLGMSYCPYLVGNFEEAKKVFAKGSFMFNQLYSSCDKLGIELIGMYIEGFEGIATNKKPNAPADPTVEKGVLLRSPGTDFFKLLGEDIGYRTTTIPYAEAYTALQTGVADGWIGGVPYIQYLWFRDVIKYYYHYKDHLESNAWVINQERLNSLTPEDRKIVMDAAQEEIDKSYEIAEKYDAEGMKLLKDEGIEVILFSDEQIQTLAQHIRKVSWPKLMDEELVNGLMKDLEK